MPTDDPEFLPATYVPGEPWPAPQIAPLFQPPPRRIPNFGHTVLFFTIGTVVMIVASVSAFAIVMGLHLMGRENSDQLLREPRLLIPSMAGGYLIAGAIVWAVFAWLSRQPFAQALHWNFGVIRRRWLPLLLGGVGLSLGVQFLSNFLPIPKTFPIDDFFRPPGDVWMVALFGTFMAPVFEELAFRGFLLPSLASSWDWFRTPRQEWSNRIFLEGSSPKAMQDPSWSAVALISSCTLTSIGFACVHADQLAHAWAPLAVLFGVSLVLCVVRLWTHSLAASAFVHATYNATIFVMIFIATGGFRHLDKIT